VCLTDSLYYTLFSHRLVPKRDPPDDRDPDQPRDRVITPKRNPTDRDPDQPWDRGIPPCTSQFRRTVPNTPWGPGNWSPFDSYIRSLRFDGNSRFDGRQWLDPANEYSDPIQTFFDWKRISHPDRYFGYQFKEEVNHSFEFHAREANVHGVRPYDFVKIVVTVAHFVERAASDYPDNETHRERLRSGTSGVQHRDFRPVPFGEIFAVLGSNEMDAVTRNLLTGTTVDVFGRTCTVDHKKVLPESDFKAHFKFLILALSWLIEVGVLHIQCKTYTCDIHDVRQGKMHMESRSNTDEVAAAAQKDAMVPYDRRVHCFQELTHKCRTNFKNFTYCFTPHETYSNLAWKALVKYLRSYIDGLSEKTAHRGPLCSDCLVAGIEQDFNYDKEKYWCSVVYRDQMLLQWDG